MIGIGFTSAWRKSMTLVDLDDFLLINKKYRWFPPENSNILTTIHEEKFLLNQKISPYFHVGTSHIISDCEM